MTDLFKELESPNIREFEEAKQKFFEQFNSVKDPWLLNGLYDYYVQSASTRAMEVLVNITEQHFGFLNDKLTESIKSSKINAKIQALALLGFIVRKEPTWLIKITQTQYSLIKDLLKLLKTETDVMPLVSALLVIIVLLPIFPAWMGQNHLKDLLEIFSRLAAFNVSNPGKISDEQMVHMQMALFSLFQRLYGMYPCNFISFLRNHYRHKETSPIFLHTIKPMITTVKMHPLLITFSTEYEISNERWKKMVPHDVIVECERFNIKTGEKCSNDSCVFAATTTFRSRSGTNPPTYETSPLQMLKGTQMMSISSENNFFSPSNHFEVQPIIEMPVASNYTPGAGQGLGVSGAYMSQEGTSPPEAAIEATPETTPIRDLRMNIRQLPQTSIAARALTNFGPRTRQSTSGIVTPSNSQPSSPMRKEPSPFNFPVVEGKHSSAFGYPKRDFPAQKVQKLLQDRTQQFQVPDHERKPPTSPLRIIPGNNGSIPGSPLLPVQRNESPVSQEDEEVLSIVNQAHYARTSGLRQCDSVLQDVEGSRAPEEEIDISNNEHGSPCSVGGLHMPNSRSINELKRRLRYYSQCAADVNGTERQSAESSPGRPTTLTAATVRRANSCPEIKKSTVPIKDNIGGTLPETAEEGGNANGVEESDNRFSSPTFATQETQTDIPFPMPYEHLFLSIYPNMGNDENISNESPAPIGTHEDSSHDIYNILDKYIAKVGTMTDRENTSCLKEQLFLIHQRLLFEINQREIASYRNRRLLTEAKNSKSLEEYNSALRDQIQIIQREIDSLRLNEKKLKSDKASALQDKANTIESLEQEIVRLKEEIRQINHKNNNLKLDLDHTGQERDALNSVVQNVEHRILDAEASIKLSNEQLAHADSAREEIIVLNRELLLTREIQSRYQERFNDLALMRNVDEEMRRASASYRNELRNLQNQVDLMRTTLESYKQRVSELETNMSHKEKEFKVQKKQENELKEQQDEKLKAIERKYKSLMTINRKLEEHIMELWQKLDLATKKSCSPDVSSCQEASSSNTVGQTQPPTPLSTSLASSDGTFLNIDPKDVKNIQITERQLQNPSDEPNDSAGPSRND